MNHPTLKHIRRVLAVALGLGAAACAEEPAGGLDPSPASCLDPQPILNPDGRETGYVRCADEAIDRVGPATCEPLLRGEACGADGFGDCAVDADCGAGSMGRCMLGAGACECRYTCAADADCPGGQICVCGALRGEGWESVCVPAECRDSTRCGGDRCGVAQFSGGCGTETLVACRSTTDTCRTNEDCAEGSCQAPGEVWNDLIGTSDWQCTTVEEVCGRPLRVAGRARRARSTRRGDWQAAMAAVAQQAAAAEHWRRIAALEHASVASFARFSLQLLALGAPAELLADCQQAAADEVEHARIAYAIASAFAGEAIGPGPLSLDGIDLDSDPETVLREVIVEGCIGETLGALEAAEAARAVDNPDIAAACARIAEDELRHAALGWRTARWLLACHPTLSAMACDTFAEGMRHHIDGIDESSAAIARHGIAVRPALRREAWRTIIAPLSRTLLAG